MPRCSTATGPSLERALAITNDILPSPTPTPVTRPTVTPTLSPRQQIEALRALVQDVATRGKEGREEREILRELQEIEKKIAEGEVEDAREKIGDLVKWVRERASKGERDPQLAEQITVGLGVLADRLP